MQGQSTVLRGYGWFTTFYFSCTSSLQVDGNLRTEPKFMVFLLQLLLLFQFCRLCKADNPLVEKKVVGSNGIVSTKCNNPKCTQKIKMWHTQPLMPERKKACAGNFLMCMATLLGGGSHKSTADMLAHGSWMCLTQHILEVSESEYHSLVKNLYFVHLES